MDSKYLKIAGFISLPFCGLIHQTFFTDHQKDVREWYNKLNLPDWKPHNWLLRPCLYVTIGYASYLIHNSSSGLVRQQALGIYGTQLVLNWLWTPLFFKCRKLGLAAIEMGLLWTSIGACIWKFYPINKTAAYLMLPYFGYIGFATFFCYNVWQRNRKKNSK